MFRLISTLVIGLLLTGTILAAEETHSGKILLAKDGKITLQDKDGNSEVFVVAADAKITLDGQPVKLGDLANGNVARVTVKTVGDKKTASVIEASKKL